MKRRYWGVIAGIIVVALAIVGYRLFLHDETAPPAENTSSETTQTAPEEPEQDPYTPIDLQPTVDAWTAKYSARYSIAVYDLQSNTMIAAVEPDEVMFAASLYKLYVAYLSLLDFQSGTQNPDDILIAGQTKRECVDKMIRESDSPCGEAMMADIGQATLNERVKSLGATNTTFNGIQTTANDAVQTLNRIAQDRALSSENRAFLLDAMEKQDIKFKRGLEKGAPGATWYTKVGWNLDVNYHDVGIMKLADGRQFAVAILGQGSGSPTPIADFAATIYQKLTTAE